MDPTNDFGGIPMRRIVSIASVVGIAILSVVLLHSHSATNAQGKKEMLLCHDVFFSLKDNSPAAKQKLVDACKKYLSGHPGEVFFSAGVLAESLNRKVNDLNFDVALHIVFTDLASQEKYQDAPRHLEFIKENKDNWKNVRVFDSLVQR
jgi:hypothetical protein